MLCYGSSISEIINITFANLNINESCEFDIRMNYVQLYRIKFNNFSELNNREDLLLLNSHNSNRTLFHYIHVSHYYEYRESN